ncbi:S8 family serine peptidase [Actinoplanes sp. NPDC048796]|uniref:S8 family serine peptidase n=1 Tax=Actinoplanes sp. NPDC048796 TaxID=3155640 RepID=UPI0033C000F3
MKTAAAAALATASLTAVTAAPALAAPADPTPSSLVVGLRSDSAAAGTVSALDAEPGISVLGSSTTPALDSLTVTVPARDRAEAVAALRDNPDVTYVEPKAVASVVSTDAPNDPSYPQQWGLSKIKASGAWGYTTGDDVVVAVIDTGVSPISELAGRIRPGYDFVNDDSSPVDDNGHGTKAASVIAAEGDDATGIAGVCWTCQILPVKVMGADGRGTTDLIAKGIVYAVDHDADVINLSLGSATDTQVVRDAVAYAAAHDVVVIASAGNDGKTTPFYPAAVPAAIAVAGSDTNDLRYTWSNYNAVGNTWVDVAAPGQNYAQGTDNKYYWFAGTSSAGPVVAGVAALARAAKPSATADQIRAAVESTTDPVGTWVAQGRVNAEKALAAITGGVTPTPVVRDNTPPSAAFSVPATATGVVPVTLTAPSDDTARMELFVADKLVATATSAPWSIDWDTAGLAGQKTVKVRVTDTSGNVITAAGVAVTIDNMGPVLKWVTPAPKGSLRGTVAVTATAADPSGVTSVDVLAGGEVIGSDDTAPYRIDLDTTTLASGETVTLRATDKVGNVTTIARALTLDNTAPTVEISVPGVLKGAVRITPTVADDVAVKQVKGVVTDDDGKVLATLVSAKAPWTLTWNTAKLAGTYHLDVTAFDTTGNTTTVATTVNVDNAAPSAAADVPAVTGGPITVALSNPSDDTAKMELLLNNKVIRTIESAPWSIEWTPTASTTYALGVRVTDAVGNVATTTRKVVTDLAGPKIAWPTPIASLPLRGTVQATMTATDVSGVASVELLAGDQVIGEDTTGPYQVEVDTTTLTATQVLTVRATDKLGNVSTLSRTFTVDNEAPVLDVALPATMSGLVKLAPTVSDNAGIKQVKLVISQNGKILNTVVAAKEPWTLLWNTTSLTGTYTLTATATDKAGNSATWTGDATVTKR